jgi:large subunit ribosomal protein L13
MKTLVAKSVAPSQRKWHIVDAAGKNLGRLSTQIARTLSGRNRVDFTPHLDNGDYVIVINTKDIAVTGNKEVDKMYYRHSGYLGGIKQKSL